MKRKGSWGGGRKEGRKGGEGEDRKERERERKGYGEVGYRCQLVLAPSDLGTRATGDPQKRMQITSEHRLLPRPHLLRVIECSVVSRNWRLICKLIACSLKFLQLTVCAKLYLISSNDFSHS